ncbi:MAG: hypothetical protein AAGG48_16820 [Planctomycetota bacterium]
MRPRLFLLLLLLSSSICYGQKAIELKLGAEASEFPAVGLSLEFDLPGEHVFSILGNKIRVFSTRDGTLVREYSLPVRRDPNERVTKSVSSFYQRGQVSLASGGKNLIVICDAYMDREGSSEAVFLIDVEDLTNGNDVSPVPILYPAEAEQKPLRFVCSIGDDQFVFVTRNRTHNDQLLLYRLGDTRIDSKSVVELDSRASRTPEYLCCGAFMTPLTYLLGSLQDGSSVEALRVVPDREANRSWQEMRCVGEKLSVFWNEDGEGAIETGETYTLPSLPIAISPNMNHHMITLEQPINKLLYRQSIGIAEFDRPLRRTPTRSFIVEHNREMGRPGVWSRDSTRFFVNDGNHSVRRRPRTISVHDASGAQVGIVSVGSGLSAEVVATSSDGDWIVTRNDLTKKPRPSSRSPENYQSAVYTLWDLRRL